ncbi:nucleopolyhedrovirus P10 family protein [Streptomyces sp. IBSBF 3136]|uniref:nucleopolyhedrovirus P10 family protein n=1 Tax=Streptomyces sp. IBSBF 3136 TaxID=2903524 RepID=UPI002FDBCBD9
MTDGWTQGVRHQLALGRLLPLGGPRDGAWIAEGAAAAVLAVAAAHLPGVRLRSLRITSAAPEDVHEPVVTPPPGALPPGPLRVTADFAAGAAEPLPETAARLRLALAAAAAERLGLAVTEVDLRVTDLLDADAPEPADRRPEAVGAARRPPAAREAVDPDEARAAAAALAVPGVARLTGSLGGLGRAVHIERSAVGASLPRRQVRVELATGAGHRAVDVARLVRAAVRDALDDHPAVAVLVTGVE